MRCLVYDEYLGRFVLERSLLNLRVLLRDLAMISCFFFQAEDGIRDWSVTGVQTCALPIWRCALDVSPTSASRSGILAGPTPRRARIAASSITFRRMRSICTTRSDESTWPRSDRKSVV